MARYRQSMAFADSNGITLYYETHGDPSHPALLLVNGYTSQITQWGDGYREALAARGLYVISFDNRDVGLSTHLDGVTVDFGAVMRAAQTGEGMPQVPYTLSTFAADAVGLLDHLGVQKAHVAGSSMGGMIVQTIAIEYPERVLSLISVMSTTSEPGYSESTPEASAALSGPPVVEREAYIAQTVRNNRVYSSPRYFDEVEAGKKAAIAFDRAFYPEGWLRQMTAFLGSPQRAEGLRALKVPTLVIHGRADTLILPKGGERTAEVIPGANLLMLHDMGHDLPRPLWPIIIDAIVSHTTHANA
jgi:pimeloyl-ACP methyl ester carboxylesterase